MKKTFEAGGYIGIALIQGANLPALVSVAMGWSTDLPPLSMVAMIWLGLALFFARSIYNRQMLYIVSEGVGITLQTILLWVIIAKHY